MKSLLSDLLEHLLSGSELTRDDLLQGVLVSGLVFATIHLVTMLVTRWGDRRAEGKALMLSVLVHLTCFVGLVTFEPGEHFASKEPVEERTAVRRSVRFDDPPTGGQRPGSSAPWNSPAKGGPSRPTRTDRREVAQSPNASRSPERTRSSPTALPMPRQSRLPLETSTARSAPRIEQVADATRRRDVEPDAFTPEAPVSERRPDSESRTPFRVAPTKRRALPEDESGLQRSETGTTELLQELPEPARAPLEVADVPSPRPEPQLSGEPLETRPFVGPAPSDLVDESVETLPLPATQVVATNSAIPARNAPTGRSVAEDEDVVRSRDRSSAPLAVEGPTRRGIAEIASLDSSAPQRPRLDTGELAPTRPRTSELPATYAERDVQRRAQVAAARGGTKSSEQAVELGLAWLARNQEPDGSWDADRHGAGVDEKTPFRPADPRLTVAQADFDRNGEQLHRREETGHQADVGVTSLAVLAFLAAGYTHDEGKYATHVDRALTWLVAGQRRDGFLGRGATQCERMYCHAMATYAIAEAFSMQADRGGDVRLREPLRLAVAYIVDTQIGQDGGWRYLKGQTRGDTSVFGWQLMALKSAELAGVPIPAKCRDDMIRFLRETSTGTRHGLAAYVRNQRVTPAMTAEALFCKQMLGIQRDNPACTEAVEHLLQNAPRRTQFNLYYWYYGTLAMFHYGGEPWRQWNELVRNILVADQITSGEHAGSWDPAKCPWGLYGGRVYSTALGTLCLEVYYRFLPLYQMAPDSPAPRPTLPPQP